MNIIIKETQVRDTLQLIDHKTGCDWVRDLIGNHDALGSQFVWDDEQAAYLVSQEDYDWWESVIADMQALDRRTERLANIKTEINVYDVLADVCATDLAHYAHWANKTLDDTFGEGVGNE